MNSKHAALTTLALAAIVLYISVPDSELMISNVKEEHIPNVAAVETTEGSLQGEKLEYQNSTETPAIQPESSSRTSMQIDL